MDNRYCLVRYVFFLPNIRFLETRYNKKLRIWPYRRIFGPLDSIVSVHLSCMNTLVVENINTNLYENVLFPLFSRAGTIYEMQLIVDEYGASRGACCITYNNLQSVEIARRQFNGFVHYGRRMGAYRSLQGDNPGDIVKYLFIEVLNGNALAISINCNEGKILFGFSAVYLSWISSKLNLRMNAVYPHYYNGNWWHLPTQDAIRHLEVIYKKKLRKIMFQRIFEPQDYYHSIRPPSTNKVLIKNIETTLYENVLFPLFELVGAIYEIRLAVNKHGLNTGFCFVLYQNRLSAEEAIKTFDGFQLKGCVLRAYLYNSVEIVPIDENTESDNVASGANNNVQDEVMETDESNRHNETAETTNAENGFDRHL